MNEKFIIADWPLTGRVRALTTTRVGGVSQFPFEENNLALHVGDNRTNVQQNRENLRTVLNLPNEPKWLQQAHSTEVVDAAAIEPDQVIADASYTTEKGVVCSVLTADCLPVVLADEKGTCVGIAHAGWRGLANGVIQALVKAMGRTMHPAYAWLGPAIGPHRFEVGKDVFESYQSQHADFAQAFTAIGANKWNLNLFYAAKLILSMMDVKHVHGGNYCTFENDKLFYSYRREGKTGRCATLIWIR